MRCLGVLVVVVASACGTPALAPAAADSGAAVDDGATDVDGVDAVAAVDSGPDAHNVLSPDPPDPVSILCGGRLGFPTLPSIPADDGITRIAAADIDGDGDRDINITNASRVLSVRGNGDGTFQTPVSTPVAAVFIALVDMSGDGKPDRVTTTQSSLIEIWINDGTGSFGAPQDYSPERPIDDMATADLNGDGKRDVVTLFSGGGEATVMFNTGSGLTAPQHYNVGLGSEALALADLNGDNRAELIVTNGAPTLSVLRNLGNGSFAPPVTYPTEFGPWAIAVGDMNEDGWTDVVVGVDPGQTQAVDVLLNIGGVLAAPQSVPVSASFAPRQLSVGDANGDAHLDVLVAETNESGLSLLVGTGTGAFNVVPLRTNDSPPAAILADVNGDSRADLLVGAGTYVTPYLGRSGATPYDLRTVLPISGWEITAAHGIDLNSDGKLDLVGTGQGLTGQPAYLLSTRIGSAGGVFGSETVTSISSYPRHTVRTDLDNDQRQDLVVVDSAVQALMNTGNGALASAGLIPLMQETTHVSAGDLDGDGLRDLVVGLQSPNGKLVWLRGLGGGQLAAPLVIWSAHHVIGSALIDLDRDGRLDLLIDDYTSPTSTARHVLRALGNGTFAAPIDTALTSFGRHFVHDVNKDGTADLVSLQDAAIAVSLGNGTLTLGAAVSSPVKMTGREVAFADVNGDGHIDLLVSGSAVAVLLGHGDGTFDPAAYYAIGHTTISPADFDGDGRVDLLVGGGTDRSMMIMHGRCL
jgi:hypothetical protein